MKLIIVRHGETKWNRENRLQGQKDIPISRIGLHQAKALAKRLSKIKIDIIYTSILRRAVRTAEEIKKFHSETEMVKEKSLNETSFGIWEGLQMDCIKKKYRGLYKKREKDKFNFKVPKGESQKMLRERVKRVIDKIIKKYRNNTILIVGHGEVN